MSRRTATIAVAAVTLAGPGLVAAGPVPGLAQMATAMPDCTGARTPDSSPVNLTDVDGTLFFTASDTTGNALWRSDGTAGGTVLLKRLPSDGYDYDYGDDSMVAVDGSLFFTVDSEDEGSELWRSDGTPDGTVRVKRFAEGGGEYGGDGPENLTAVGDTLFFTASDEIHGEELWRSDGTRAGTVLVEDIGTDADSDYAYGPSNLTAVGDTLFFTADDGSRGAELWRSDGTRSGTALVADVRPGAYSSDAGHLTAVGDTLFFRARDGVHGRELWRSDGTADGTSIVEDVLPGSASANPDGLVAAGERLFFSAEDAADTRDLWVSDGTAAGTVLVRDFAATGGYSDEYALRDLVAVDDAVFFAADDGAHGLELWRSDGTEAGTLLVEDVRPGDYPGYPESLTVVGSRVFFTARDGMHGRELWTADGTGASLVEDIATNGDGGPRELTESGGALYFQADDGIHGEELWRSDGTGADASIVADINQGGGFAVSRRARYDAETGKVRVRVELEGPGTVRARSVGPGGVKRLARDVAGRGVIEVTLGLELTRAARRELRRTGEVEIGVKFTFASCGGAERRLARFYTLGR